ncbi:MAG: hypothetical protein V3W11_06485 [bacterium]
MGSRTFIVFLAALAAAGAWATDLVVAPTAPAASGAPNDYYDGPLELKYDSGTQRYFVAWISGAGNWVGNDFDISAISTYRAIMRVRFYSTPTWPNSKWDGFRVGIYAYAGGQPGSVLWGPEYFKPRKAGAGWVNCAVGWTLPPANDAFVAAVEQYYNYPNLDPFALDNNPTFRNHSWQYSRGSWRPFSQANVAPYRNVMLRVVVNNVPVGVTPTSVGRVKALYY